MDTPSSALAVLRSVYLEGLRVDVTSDGTPTIRGGTPSPELLVHLKEHRQTIIEELARQRIGEHDDGFNSPIRRLYAVPVDCLSTKACARLGMCSEALRRLPCDHAELWRVSLGERSKYSNGLEPENRPEPIPLRPDPVTLDELDPIDRADVEEIVTELRQGGPEAMAAWRADVEQIVTELRQGGPEAIERWREDVERNHDLSGDERMLALLALRLATEEAA